MKLYGYKKCGTCLKAMKWLDQQCIAYQFIDITQHPPPATTLKLALRSGYKLRDLFNKSGRQYRELNMKDKLPAMNQPEAVKLLAGNGYLCKRPIGVDGQRITVGFQEESFAAVWG
ncbi:MAG: Spx/MgsR family RNA polymerase-binding regulatory protein [Planctomycetota bacterium]